MGGLYDSKCWELLCPDADAERRLCSELGVSPLVGRIMAARGMIDVQAADRFLHPDLGRDWHDPLCIPGMYEAANRVESAIDSGESIAVFGDFDVDGMSSTALLTQGLRALGAREVRPYIPDRFDEGYGLSRDALSRVMEDGKPDLIVTVDNGIASAAEVAWLESLGIDVVVTDHHEPSELVPHGAAVCDPKLDPECKSFDLAGAGVALKLVCELGRRKGMPELWLRFTDLATLGTVSDMMRLLDENRALVATGIAQLQQGRRPGIVALAAAAHTQVDELTSESLPFTVIPRLNAAGRMGHTELAFKLLMSDDPADAAILAAQLETINTERRDIEAALAKEAMAAADTLFSPDDRCVVVAGQDWHEGVKGIVASRLANRYHVPSILFSVSDGVARGSGRSVGSVNLFQALERCSDLLTRFGGHAAAVGVTLDAANIDAFRARLSEVLAELPPEQFISRGEVAAVVGLGELDVDTIRSLEVLQPFGQANKKPLLAACGVGMRNRGRVGAAGEHLRFVASDGLNHVSAIMFRTPDIERAVCCDTAVDLVFEAVAETWQGTTKPKLMVRDIVYRDCPTDTEYKPSTIADSLFEQADTNSAHAPASPSSCGQEELAHLSPSALDSALVHAFIGDHKPLAAQSRALEVLGKGHSCMCVMATGRGKSLIFHVHAARLAITSHKASIFVYPLRALVADQAHHLECAFAPLGLEVAVLTGDTPEAERASIYAQLAAGALDVVLTTPEYLAIHTKDIAASGRIGFVAIDEAHHASRARAGERASYLELPRILAELGNPCVLAASATCDSEATREVCRLCGIAEDNIVVDATSRTNLTIDDLRGIRERELALINLVAQGKKCVIYVNSRADTIELARMLRKNIPDLASRIAFYNAGLDRTTRTKIERALRKGELCCIVSTSAFGEGVNLPDIRHVVLYHLPFGAVEFNQMSGRAGRDGVPSVVHLMFGQADIQRNERLVARATPGREELVVLWRALGSLAKAHNFKPFLADDDTLVAASAAIDARTSLEAATIERGLGIFSELGLVSVREGADGFTLEVPAQAQRVDLGASIRYVEGIKTRDSFDEFRAWALSTPAQQMLERVINPIVPEFGWRAPEEKD